MTYPDFVTIYEVGPRDGLQNESGVVSTDLKVELIERLGGCSFANGAKGNVATEDVLYMLNGMGIETGIDFDKLIDTSLFISDALGRRPAARVAQAIQSKRQKAS